MRPKPDRAAVVFKNSENVIPIWSVRLVLNGRETRCVAALPLNEFADVGIVDRSNRADTLAHFGAVSQNCLGRFTEVPKFIPARVMHPYFTAVSKMRFPWYRITASPPRRSSPP